MCPRRELVWSRIGRRTKPKWMKVTPENGAAASGRGRCRVGTAAAHAPSERGVSERESRAGDARESANRSEILHNRQTLIYP